MVVWWFVVVEAPHQAQGSPREIGQARVPYLLPPPLLMPQVTTIAAAEQLEARNFPLQLGTKANVRTPRSEARGWGTHLATFSAPWHRPKPLTEGGRVHAASHPKAVRIARASPPAGARAPLWRDAIRALSDLLAQLGKGARVRQGARWPAKPEPRHRRTTRHALRPCHVRPARLPGRSRAGVQQDYAPGRLERGGPQSPGPRQERISNAVQTMLRQPQLCGIARWQL